MCVCMCKVDRSWMHKGSSAGKIMSILIFGKMCSLEMCSDVSCRNDTSNAAVGGLLTYLFQLRDDFPGWHSCVLLFTSEMDDQNRIASEKLWLCLLLSRLYYTELMLIFTEFARLLRKFLGSPLAYNGSLNEYTGSSECIIKWLGVFNCGHLKRATTHVDK